MPTYTYKCAYCNSTWDEMHKISERDKPTETYHEKCGYGPVTRIMLEAPSMGDAVRLGFTRPNSGMREVLQRVQEKAPAATVKDNSSLTRL